MREKRREKSGGRRLQELAMSSGGRKKATKGRKVWEKSPAVEEVEYIGQFEPDLKPSRRREIEVEEELNKEKRLRDINQRQMEELKEKERDLEKLKKERMKRELEKKEEEMIAIEKREKELKEREKRLDEAARNIKRIDALFSGTDGGASQSNVSKHNFKVFRRSRSRSKIRLGSRSRSCTNRNDWESRGTRLDGNINSRGKSSTVRGNCEPRGARQSDKSNRRGNSLRASLTKGRLELEGRVRMRNDLMTNFAPVTRVNGDKAQYGQHNRRHKRERLSEDEQRRKEERYREELKQKERKGLSSRSAKPPPKGVPVSKDNANLVELGSMKTKSSSGGFDGSGGAEGYSPASLLKSALTKENKKQNEYEQRRKEERLREQLRQKEAKVKERMRQKEQEQKLKEKLRVQQIMRRDF